MSLGDARIVNRREIGRHRSTATHLMQPTYRHNPKKRRKMIVQIMSRLLAIVAIVAIGVLAYYGGRSLRHGMTNSVGPVRSPQLNLTIIDSAGGDCALITLPQGKRILFDAGPDASHTADILAALGPDKTVDLVILTSSHSQSIGGASALINAIKVKGFVLLPTENKRFRRSSRSARLVLEACRKHGVFAMSTEHYTALHTSPADTTNPIQIAGLPVASINRDDAAMALRIEYGGSAIIYAAGLNGPEERDLLGRNDNLTCDVLCMPSGGGLESTAPQLMALCGPQAITLSVAKNQPLDNNIVRWMIASGAQIGRTDLLGSFALNVDQSANQQVTWTSGKK